MDVTWLAVSAKTGQVLEELPDLQVATVGATIGTHFAVTASLPTPSAPPGWLDATKPLAAALVLLINDEPIWAGLIGQRKRGTAETVSLAVASWESYLARRYVGTKSYAGVPQCTIVADLVNTFVIADGPAMLVEVEGSTGQSRDRSYKDDADKTVDAALSELSGIIAGPEWTITPRRLTSPERYVPVVRIANRLGTSPVAGLRPAAIFDQPGCVIDAELSEDYSSGRGATRVVATSSATGDVRPQSGPADAADPERPRVEYRWSPSSSITEISTLNAHAGAALAAMRGGASAIVLTADLQQAPRLGVDWALGDDVGYDLSGQSFPQPVQGIGRAIGWQMSLVGTPTVTPILEGGS